MKTASRKGKIVMIPVDKINILNPRVRNKKQYRAIADNVVQVGLKRPITVTPCKSDVPGKEYDLVCGQGRLEIFIACGQPEIPAVVIDVSGEEAMIMSIVENMARRQHSPVELIKGIDRLTKQGYSVTEISEKTGLAWVYVRDIGNLIEKGEERLIAAVESSMIPITVAVEIANSPGQEQQALQDAYESKQLRGKKLLMARKLIETRKNQGKGMKRGGRTVKKIVSTAEEIINAYQQDVSKKKLLVRKSEMVNNNLLFIVEALRRLYGDENFKNLLKAEGMTSFPKILAEMLEQRGVRYV